METAIKSLKEGKSTRLDGMQHEFIKPLDEESTKIICKMFSNIYDTGNIPNEWLITEFILLTKNKEQISVKNTEPLAS